MVSRVERAEQIRRKFTPLRNAAVDDFPLCQCMTNVINLCDSILREPDRPELEGALDQQLLGVQECMLG